MTTKKSAHGGRNGKAATNRKTSTRPVKAADAIAAAKSVLKLRKRKSGRNYYDDEERAAIMAAVDANGGNVEGTAKLLGVPNSTVHCWKAGHRCPEALQLRNEKKGKLADTIDEIVWAILARLPGKIESAPFNHLATGAGILIDKSRLLRNLPTTINENNETRTTINVSELTAEECEYLIGLHERASVETRSDGNTRIEPTSLEASGTSAG